MYVFFLFFEITCVKLIYLPIWNCTVCDSCYFLVLRVVTLNPTWINRLAGVVFYLASFRFPTIKARLGGSSFDWPTHWRVPFGIGFLWHSLLCPVNSDRRPRKVSYLNNNRFPSVEDFSPAWSRSDYPNCLVLVFDILKKYRQEKGNRKKSSNSRISELVKPFES